jgi:hypothetical protein
MEYTNLLLYKLNKYQKKLEINPCSVIYQSKYAYYNDLIGGKEKIHKIKKNIEYPDIGITIHLTIYMEPDQYKAYKNRNKKNPWEISVQKIKITDIKFLGLDAKKYASIDNSNKKTYEVGETYKLNKNYKNKDITINSIRYEKNDGGSRDMEVSPRGWSPFSLLEFLSAIKHEEE